MGIATEATSSEAPVEISVTVTSSLGMRAVSVVAAIISEVGVRVLSATTAVTEVSSLSGAVAEETGMAAAQALSVGVETRPETEVALVSEICWIPGIQHGPMSKAAHYNLGCCSEAVPKCSHSILG